MGVLYRISSLILVIVVLTSCSQKQEVSKTNEVNKANQESKAKVESIPNNKKLWDDGENVIKIINRVFNGDKLTDSDKKTIRLFEQNYILDGKNANLNSHDLEIVDAIDKLNKHMVTGGADYDSNLKKLDSIYGTNNAASLASTNSSQDNSSQDNSSQNNSSQDNNSDNSKSTPTEPTIGMTADKVLHSTWGRPEHINKTTTANGVSEQWVYGIGRYIYLEDGIVTAIQDSQ